MPLEAASRAAFHPLRVASVHRETEDAVAVGLEVPEGLRERFAFTPGQYLTLRTVLDGEDVRRSYSICSGLDDPELRVAIKRVEEGRFSGWAHAALRPGQVIEAMAPAGRFTLPPEPPGHVLAIAAGSGITPILSIAKTVLARQAGMRVTLLYGSRSTGQILFRDELEALKDRYLSRFAVTHVLSREQQDIPILNGRLDGAKIAALLPRPLPDLALLCGPASLIDEGRAALEAAGMAGGRILSERFTPSGEPVRRAARATGSERRDEAWAVATVIADGTATPVPLLEGETVLDGALRAGLDLPYSCRAGMCSTCRARVTAGRVRMDVNYGLEPWETQAGFVLTCQAHPEGEHPEGRRVTVDYDHV